MKPLKRIGVLMGGGDCPGLNAVTCSIARSAVSEFGAVAVGILDGFEGLVEGRMRDLTMKVLAGMCDFGGPALGTSMKGDPFHFPVETPQGIDILDCSENAMKNYRDWRLDAIIAAGGDGTMHVVEKLTDLGLDFIGIPKTVDNDLSATDISFGYDSALAIAAEAIDRLRSTASARHRVMVVEVTGRYAGWIALGAGVAGGADIILVPEIPFRWEKVCEEITKRGKYGSRFSIVCVAEGARPAEVGALMKEEGAERGDRRRAGGIGDLVGRKIAEMTGLETRVILLGHLQRSGRPTAFDRILASKLGVKALQLAAEEKFGQMVSVQGQEVLSVPVGEAAQKLKTVALDSELIAAARAAGSIFGI